MNKELEHYEVKPESSDLFTISLVDKPAIESDFIHLSNQKSIQVHFDNQEKHLCVGAVLIPNLDIYRRDEWGEYTVRFSEQAIETLSQEFLKFGYQGNINTDHKDDTEDCYVVESWIKTDMEKDKSLALGLDATLPIGTWFASIKINDDDVWQNVKDGKFNGFSIEAFVDLQKINLNKIDDMRKNVKQEEQITVNDGFWDKIKEMIKEAINTPAEEVAVEEVAEEIVEEIKDEEVVEEVALSEEVAEEVAVEVVDVIEEEAENAEEVVEDLQAIVDDLNAKIDEMTAEIEDLKKANQKMSKQPSTKPVKVSASAKSNPRDVIESLYSGTYFKK